jgi:hypothetical protein
VHVRLQGHGILILHFSSPKLLFGNQGRCCYLKIHFASILRILPYIASGFYWRWFKLLDTSHVRKVLHTRGGGGSPTMCACSFIMFYNDPYETTRCHFYPNYKQKYDHLVEKTPLLAKTRLRWQNNHIGWSHDSPMSPQKPSPIHIILVNEHV